jgi:hypothetical protein
MNAFMANAGVTHLRAYIAVCRRDGLGERAAFRVSEQRRS